MWLGKHRRAGFGILKREFRPDRCAPGFRIFDLHIGLDRTAQGRHTDSRESTAREPDLLQRPAYLRDDRIALLYSCSVSQSVKITSASLLNGAALYPFNIRQRGVAQVADWLVGQEVTIFFSVPVLFRHFAATLTGEEVFPHLRIIQLGSDLVTRREFEEYQRHFSANTILVIRLGTTETGTVRRMY